MALPGLWANLGQLGLWQFVGLEYIKFILLYLLRLGCVKLTINIMAVDVDMTKRAGWVNRITGQNRSFLNGSIRLRVELGHKSS